MLRGWGWGTVHSKRVSESGLGAEHLISKTRQQERDERKDFVLDGYHLWRQADPDSRSRGLALWSYLSKP